MPGRPASASVHVRAKTAMIALAGHLFTVLPMANPVLLLGWVLALFVAPMVARALFLGLVGSSAGVWAIAVLVPTPGDLRR